MPAAAEIARRHYASQRRRSAALAAEANRLWRTVDFADLDRSWRGIGPTLQMLLVAVQVAAASDADSYVAEVLAAQGVDADPEGHVSPNSLAGVASDGRALDTLLAQAIIATKLAIGSGATQTRALATGQASLEMILMTQAADAGRVADGVALAARPTVSGYVRMLSPPSCSRCAILAGRFYRWSAGFQRHPMCDCRHIPSLEDRAGDLRTDPMAAFRAGRITDLSKRERQAIEDGAGLAAVVNARRGRYLDTAGHRLTTEGTGRQRGAMRLMPEQIYRDANGDRDEAIRLLRRFGFII